MIQIALAIEDDLSAAVGHRLLAESFHELAVHPRFQFGGAAGLRTHYTRFARFAERHPLLLLTDLDQAECPPALIRSWTNARGKPERMIFRIAVREIEAWLLADHDAIWTLIGGRKVMLPEEPDFLENPKKHLLLLARRSSRLKRGGFFTTVDGNVRQGVAYNATLDELVRTQWSPARAAKRSESLRRTRERIRELAARL